MVLLPWGECICPCPVETRGWLQVSSSITFFLIFRNKVSHWTWNLLIQVDWLTSKPKVPHISISPVLGLQGHFAALGFCVGAWIKLKSPCLCSQVPHQLCQLLTLAYSKVKSRDCLDRSCTQGRQMVLLNPGSTISIRPFQLTLFFYGFYILIWYGYVFSIKLFSVLLWCIGKIKWKKKVGTGLTFFAFTCSACTVSFDQWRYPTQRTKISSDPSQQF